MIFKTGGKMNIVLIQILILIIGFIMLIKGADFLIDGAVGLSRKLQIPEIVIGLTVIAFGTSMPELVVNGFAAFAKQGDVIYGNVIGSNIANILLILGVTGLLCPIFMPLNTVKKEIPISFFAIIILWFISKDGILSRIDALILLGFFIGFLLYIVKLSKTGTEEIKTTNSLTSGKMFLFLIIGFVGLIYGGKLVVDSAVKIAMIFNVSKKLIALTIVSVGTSLPELAASIIAAKKGQTDIAVGNVIGSNIFNIFLIMGTSGMIFPVNYDFKFNFDIVVLLYATLLPIGMAYVGRRYFIDKYNALILIGSYVVYIVYSIYIS
jgi:cation:H+ antiporter